MKLKLGFFSYLLFFSTNLILNTQASILDPVKHLIVENVLLLKIVSEPQNNLIHTVYLHLDDNGHILGATREGGGDATSFTMDQINQDKVLLAESQGYKAVYITCKNKNCTPEKGGLLDLEYLKNALFNIYDHFEIEIKKVNNEWFAYSKNGALLKSFKLVKGMVGIKKIEINPL